MKKKSNIQFVNKLLKYAKKHKGWKVPIILFLLPVMGVGEFCALISHNSKKLISVACLSLFFVLSCSFASIRFVPTVDTSEYTVNAAKPENVELSPEELATIEDTDVIDGYEDQSLEGSKTDYYSVDEILDENPVQTEKLPSDTEQTVLDKSDWRLLLINKQHPIPDDYEFTLGTIKGNMQCDERIIDDLFQMLQGARADGVNLVICSPYRDMNRQEVLFNRKIEAYMKKGMSYMDAYKISAQAVTVPGASEHQIGLALDIICDSYSSLDEGFGDTEAGKWLAEHSCDYGFILRYPQGKEYITSIEYEPWHFRYVGKEAAKQITDQGITLEELVESL